MNDFPERVQKARSNYPFYSAVLRQFPDFRTPEGNLEFRTKILKDGFMSEENAREIWVMCSRDMLFFINIFLFTYNPRLVPKSTVIPFVTYEFQDVCFHDIKEAIEKGNDELSEKSRDMGASWIYLIVFLWFWLFRDYQTFRVMSRTEDLVDKTDDPDSLFWKLLFMIKYLPSWLRPNYTRNHLHLKNDDNNSTIEGVTTTSDSARGGRCTAMLVDEFAAVPDGHGILSATRDVTRCRLFNSTHKGAATAFYALSIGNIQKLVLHWSIHPEKNKSLYYSDKDGVLHILDNSGDGQTVYMAHTRKKYKFPDEYPFVLDGKLRSPWYDNECDRAAHPMEIAQELDMDPFSSDFQFFDAKVIGEIEKRDVRPPVLQGELIFDDITCEPLEFAESKDGTLKLWLNLDGQGNMPSSVKAGAAFDISAGTGASNSTGSVVNLLTGEKLAEFADPWMKPESFAKLATAICRFFNDAYMIWDGGGPGRTFGDTVVKLGYTNIYYKRNEKSLSKKVSDIPGCFLVQEEKKAVLGAYRRHLKDGTFTQRSHEANQECLSFIFTTAGKIEHSAATNTIDPSGAGDNHGDRTIADALAAKLLDIKKVEEVKKDKMPKNCYAARRLEVERKRREEKYW